MLRRLFPERLDNAYTGHPLGLWLFGLVVAARILQAAVVTFDTASVAKSADGIPLDTFGPAAAQAVVSLFALTGIYRLVIGVLCVLVLVRYRNAVALMCALLVLESIAKVVHQRLAPLATGTPPGPYVNLTLSGLLLVSLVLALWPRRRAQAKEAR
ncbi:MAG: hypothetical protein F9K18_08140 [Thermoanaerobaculia bacterium]|nr:MAG: hypothetical protein F9K18_08140 [Thermoanaerobaculia bacterium]